MRPFRYPILLLVLAIALLVALVRPLPSNATETVTATGKEQARKFSRYQLRHRAAIRARRTFGRRVVTYARRFVGVPYSWGGSSPGTGFDCSGFVRFVYSRLGYDLPHSSYGQFGVGRQVPRAALRPGDLVFFDGVGHVGIYVGSNRFVHAPHSGTRVSVDSISGWYGARYDGARRLA